MAEDVIRFENDVPDADRALLLQVRKTLWDYEPIRATRPTLDVQVADGRVRVVGRLRTLAMKEIAEYLLLRLDGVRAVRNDVIADPEVVRAVADALAADEALAPLCIRVDARNGEVILAGRVPDAALAERARDIAAAVPDVYAVDDRLQIGPEVAATSNGRSSAAIVQKGVAET